MVQFSATVSSNPKYFVGAHTHSTHEAFTVQTPAGPASIVDNVGIAPPVPVTVGDAIQVRGEMVHDRGKPFPVVHWTHHDPSHRHPDGFIRFHGKRYA